MVDKHLQQINEPHPLGFHIWRNGGGWPSIRQNVREAWWCLTGKWSLHRAWQKGYDQHIMDESARRARGGK
jgi:hypothetical protein